MAFTSVKGDGSRFLYTGALSNLVGEAIDRFEAKGYVSRKKQFVPGIASALK